MDSSLLQLLIALGCGLILIIFGVLFLIFPPKKVNHIYGYRTKRSMLNKDTWDSAHQHAAYWMIKFGVANLIISGIMYVLVPEYNVLISMSTMVILVVIIIPLTENHLKRRYDDEGNPKSVVESFDAISSRHQSESE